MRYVRQFLCAIWADWASRMSGIAGLILIAIALVFRLTEVAQARYWLAAAVVCYVIASFSVWQKEKANSEKLQGIIESLQQITENSPLTPPEIVRVFEGRTSLQGKKLAEAYIGKWITVTGSVSDVSSYSSDQVSVSFSGRPIISMYFTASQWG